MPFTRPASAFTRATVSRLVLTSLLALPAAGAFAQATAPIAPSATASSADSAARMQGHHGGRYDPAAMQARLEKRQAELKHKLNLSPGQETAWLAFTDAMKPVAAPMHRSRGEYADLAKLTTPERIDKMRALRAEHMAEMTRQMDQRGEATKTFYSSLTAEQKLTFDAEAGPRGGRHGGGRAGGH